MSDIEAAKPSCMPPAAAALLEGGMAEPIVGRALLRVGEVLIGLVELLEPRLGILVAGVAVWVTLHRRLSEGGFQLGFGCRFETPRIS